jgi:hypothetical protein
MFTPVGPMNSTLTKGHWNVAKNIYENRPLGPRYNPSRFALEELHEAQGLLFRHIGRPKPLSQLPITDDHHDLVVNRGKVLLRDHFDARHVKRPTPRF